MNRTHLILGLIVVASLLAPSMFCLIPGATLSSEEMECCRQMGSRCGDFQMPAHACCKVTTPSGESSFSAHGKLLVPIIETAGIYNVLGILPDPPISLGRNQFDTTPLPLLLPLHSTDILRI